MDRFIRLLAREHIYREQTPTRANGSVEHPGFESRQAHLLPSTSNPPAFSVSSTNEMRLAHPHFCDS